MLLMSKADTCENQCDCVLCSHQHPAGSDSFLVLEGLIVMLTVAAVLQIVMSAPTAHLLCAIDPATGKPLEANKLKAEVAAFMAAGGAVILACAA